MRLNLMCLFVPTMGQWTGAKFPISTEISFSTNVPQPLDRLAFSQY